MRILIVEDDADISANLYDYLSARGHDVDAALNGLVALHLATSQPFDAIVLDVGLPGMDGLALAQRLRRDARLAIPILMLTARDTLDDKLAGFDAGADDYLVKPFDPDELKARLRALLRRSAGRAELRIEHAGVSLDPSSQQVSYQGKPVPMTPKEYLLLHELLSQPGKVLTRERLAQLLYGWDEEAESNALEVHIHHLRKKLFPELIRTVRGVGYLVDKA